MKPIHVRSINKTTTCPMIIFMVILTGSCIFGYYGPRGILCPGFERTQTSPNQGRLYCNSCLSVYINSKSIMLKRAFFYLNTNGFDACLIKRDSIFHFLFVMVKYQDFLELDRDRDVNFTVFCLRFGMSLWSLTPIMFSWY